MESVIETVRKVTYVIREEGLENSVLRAVNRLGITSIEDYILYHRWGFDRNATDFEVRTLSIDPSAVIYTHSFPFDVLGENAIVGEGGGPWYRCVKRFDDYRLFEAIHERFVHGKEWEETEMYKTEIRRIERGEKAWNACESKEEIDERCKGIDKLYDDIKANGYRTQEELREISYHPTDAYYYQEVGGVRLPDELRIALGPDGELIRVGGGRHRLAIAQLLEIDEIPAVVQIQHEQCCPQEVDEFGFSKEFLSA